MSNISTDKEIPEYKWVQGIPDPVYYTKNGCHGCDFRYMKNIRCSLIPCQRHPGMVAKIINSN